MDLPIVFGIDKKQADPVISNVQVKSESGVYHVTGDVNNAGLETANSVMVTSLPPAVPQDPYKTYVVGALKPDGDASGALQRGRNIIVCQELPPPLEVLELLRAATLTNWSSGPESGPQAAALISLIFQQHNISQQGTRRAADQDAAAAILRASKAAV
jgi:hypothetical protein